MTRLCIGLISGTSADAAEAALVEIRGTGARARVRLIGHRSFPFERALAARILSAESARDVCELDAALGERFAAAALRLLRALAVKKELDADLVARNDIGVLVHAAGEGRLSNPVLATFRKVEVFAN